MDILTHGLLGGTLAQSCSNKEASCDAKTVDFFAALVAVTTMTLTFGSSILFFIKSDRLQLMLALFGLTMAFWLYRVPLRDKQNTVAKPGGKEERS